MEFTVNPWLNTKHVEESFAKRLGKVLFHVEKSLVNTYQYSQTPQGIAFWARVNTSEGSFVYDSYNLRHRD